MDSLNASEQRELNTRIEKRQMKDMMSYFSKLVQGCFDDCVNDFTTKSLLSKEEGCISRCVDKYLKGADRIQQRFQEQNLQMQQQGGFGK